MSIRVPALAAATAAAFFVPGNPTSANQLLATAQGLSFTAHGRLNLSEAYAQLATAMGKVKRYRAVADWDAVARALVARLSEAATLNITIYNDLGQDAGWQPWLIKLLKDGANRTREDRYSREDLEAMVLKLAHYDKWHSGTSAWADAAKEPGQTVDYVGAGAANVLWASQGPRCPNGCMREDGRPHLLPPSAVFCKLCMANVPAWMCLECKMATPIAYGSTCANAERGGCPGVRAGRDRPLARALQARDGGSRPSAPRGTGRAGDRARPVPAHGPPGSGPRWRRRRRLSEPDGGCHRLRRRRRRRRRLAGVAPPPGDVRRPSASGPARRLLPRLGGGARPRQLTVRAGTRL